MLTSRNNYNGNNDSDNDNDDSDPWSVVAEYLRSTPASSRPLDLPYTLDSQLVGQKELHILLPLAAGETTLGRIRREKWQNSNTASTADRALLPASEPAAGISDSIGDFEWAAKQLRALSDLDSPDFASASQIWQLPSAELSALCQAHLSLNNCNGAALAGFISATVSNPEVSLENQHLLLRCAASSTWFTSEDAIPAIVQSQILALLQAHAQTIATGLLLSLLEHSQRLSPSAMAMVVKTIKADSMPAAALEAVCAGLATLATKTPSVVGGPLFQAMEALVSAVPVDRPSTDYWVKDWVGVLEIAAQTNGDSKKLGALMLHLLNKFGGKLDGANLERIATAASVLSTPLNKAVVAAAARRRKERPAR
ncbi:hypothetical protein GGI00_001832 [Coemansia sp. RSA 2681]|nr:hypothetical protein GGI00_001832 [Coemansia sp. RSA 2681]